jgi:hypothetical protein
VKAAPIAWTSPRDRSSLWAPLLAIAAAAFAVEIPFFFFGTPSGHDVEFHLYSWLDVVAQWKHGVFFPRWAAQAHFGYGEPRFIFYPPASWTLGGLLAAILPWSVASAVYIWIALMSAGSSMFVLARKWFTRRDAIFAAVLYTANPYHLVIVYWRSAFAELLASWLLPMLVLAVVNAAERDGSGPENDARDGWRGWLRDVVPISLVLAAAWMTNAPAAVMIHYSLGLLLVLFFLQRRSPRFLAVGAIAVLLGACLAAFYLLPAIYEQKWVNISDALSSGFRPADNFLFTRTGDPAHDAFNQIITWVAAIEIVAALAAAWAARGWRRDKPALWRALFGWSAVCCLLMFSVTSLFWRILPKLAFMQFPWRWLLCLSMLFAIFITVGVRQWWTRAAVWLVTIFVIVGAWNRIQAPWWDNRSDLREMRDNMEDGIGYEGVDEYTPAGIDASGIDQAGTDAASNGIDDAIHAGAKDRIPPKVSETGSTGAVIHIERWDAESKMFTVQTSKPDQLALRLFPYPAWRVEVNGVAVHTGVLESTSEMLVLVEAGLSRVQVTFMRTWDRAAGGWISAITAFLLLVGAARARTFGDLK